MVRPSLSGAPTVTLPCNLDGKVVRSCWMMSCHKIPRKLPLSVFLLRNERHYSSSRQDGELLDFCLFYSKRAFLPPISVGKCGVFAEVEGMAS